MSTYVRRSPLTFEFVARQSRLEQGLFQDQATIQFRGADGEVFDLRLGGA